MPKTREGSNGRGQPRRQPNLSGSLQGTPQIRRTPSRKPGKLPQSGREAKLRARLKIAEDILAGIRSGEVDAVVLSGRRGEQVVALKGGEPAYRMLVEAMSEGAATISSDGAVIYSNRRFAELIRIPPEKVAGLTVQSVIEKTDRERFETLLAQARKGIAKGEFNLRLCSGGLVPVHLSLSKLPGYRGRALSVVVTDLSEPKRRQAEEIKRAEAISRLLLERVLSAQEEERRRIARELHDEAGQLLTSLLVGLRALEDSRNIASAKAAGRTLREITTQAIDEVGRLARGLHPAALDDHGLAVALSRYVAEYTKIHNIGVELTLAQLDSWKLPQVVQVGLYRILQEALTNVARHSRARSVSIIFSCSSTLMHVSVTDDGCGFDAEAAVSSNRLGIHSMKERAAMLGGSVHFTSARKGSQVLVQIPLTTRQVEPPTARSIV
jgi:PAS domain S-box-containing protein